MLYLFTYILSMKILIIIPYFGRFPNYFNLFLKSCAANDSINWLLVTDQNMDTYKVPSNFIVMNKNFSDIQKIAYEKCGSLPQTPYDLCKYRVAYHELFLECIKGYDFWGFCDCDLIFGNIRHFLKDTILNQYDKISWRGHLTLFKYTASVNKVYQTEIPGFKTFKGCILGTDGLNLFDEVGINKIFDKLNLKIYKELPFADLRIRNNNFICSHEIFDPETNLFQIFRWSNGDLFRIYLYHGKIKEEAIAYVHFLKRPMQWADKTLIDENSFLIVPNCFIRDEVLTEASLQKFAEKKFYWSYWLSRINIKFLFNKIKGILNHENFEADEYVR